jgi:hypothetical protein
MGAVATMRDAVSKRVLALSMIFRKKLWTSKRWLGGMPTAVVMRKGNNYWRKIKMIQKSKLKQVPVEQRVPGRVYGVADECRNEINFFAIYNDGDSDVHGREWVFWFALPESMLPVRELPDEFELKHGEWEGILTNKCDRWGLTSGMKYRRIKPTLPSLTIPSGSKSEQIAELEKILAELKQS